MEKTGEAYNHEMIDDDDDDDDDDDIEREREKKKVCLL